MNAAVASSSPKSMYSTIPTAPSITPVRSSIRPAGSRQDRRNASAARASSWAGSRRAPGRFCGGSSSIPASSSLCARTAAGMLVAEHQFRRIIGYSDLAKVVIAIERRHLTLNTPERHNRHSNTASPKRSLPSDHQSP
jgi:hypothetical protein